MIQIALSGFKTNRVHSCRNAKYAREKVCEGEREDVRVGDGADASLPHVDEEDK